MHVNIIGLSSLTDLRTCRPSIKNTGMLFFENQYLKKRIMVTFGAVMNYMLYFITATT